MTPPALSIIVISYNTREMTLECLRSVFSETKNSEFELVVLDNASTDGSVLAIREEFGNHVTLIALSENLGFAAGNNRAIKDAKGQYLLLLNPDTVVLDCAIDRLIAFARSRPEAGIWGGRTLTGGGQLDPTSCWSRQTIWSLICRTLGLATILHWSSIFNPEGMGGWDRNGEREVAIVTGCFLLINKDLWEALGGFREEFFMYGEESDLCLRAQALGAKPMVTSGATIIHYGGASEKIRADKLVRLLKAKNLLIQFHFSTWSRWLGLYLLFLWPLSRYAGHSVLSVLGRDSSREAATTWGEVLHRKAEWYVLRGNGGAGS